MNKSYKASKNYLNNNSFLVIKTQIKGDFDQDELDEPSISYELMFEE